MASARALDGPLRFPAAQRWPLHMYSRVESATHVLRWIPADLKSPLELCVSGGHLVAIFCKKCEFEALTDSSPRAHDAHETDIAHNGAGPLINPATS